MNYWGELDIAFGAKCTTRKIASRPQRLATAVGEIFATMNWIV